MLYFSSVLVLSCSAKWFFNFNIKALRFASSPIMALISIAEMLSFSSSCPWTVSNCFLASVCFSSLAFSFSMVIFFATLAIASALSSMCLDSLVRLSRSVFIISSAFRFSGITKNLVFIGRSRDELCILWFL